MTNLIKRSAFAVLIPLALSVMSIEAFAQRGYDCAHGPDTWRVRNVASWDQLNIRSGPSARRRIIGAIPYNGKNVHCLGPCRGNWCRIWWSGYQGWVNMRYLGE